MSDPKNVYSTALMRALHHRLFSRKMAERMITARSEPDALKVLRDCGYPEMNAVKELEPAISSRRGEIFKTVFVNVGDKSALDVFRIRYDYHNLKGIIKAENMPKNTPIPFMDHGRVPVSRLADIMRSQNYGDMPRRMAEAAVEGRETFARTGDPRILDFTLDKAMFVDARLIAQTARSPFLTDYVKLLIDSGNTRTAARLLRTGERGVLRQALIPCGSETVDRMVQALSAGAALSEVVPFALREAAALGEAVIRGEPMMPEFERALDNAQVAYIRKALYIPFGDAPVIAYLAAGEFELAAVRTIMASRAAGLSQDAIRARLRDFYAV